MGIHMLTKQTKKKLYIVTIVSNNKIVDEYYHQIIMFRQYAKTLDDQQTKKFKLILTLVISHSLLVLKFIKIMYLLDAI